MEESYGDALKEIEEKHYKSVKRYSGKAFRPSKLKQQSSVEPWKPEEMFRAFDRNGDGTLSAQELLRGVEKVFGLRLTPAELESLRKEAITMHNFAEVIAKILTEFGTK